MYSSIQHYCESLTQEFDSISLERKQILEPLILYIRERIHLPQPIQLTYICTHNSRRSHFGQVWGKVAAEFYGFRNIYTYSGGTEATAFNLNAIGALERVGFNILSDEAEMNPHYQVIYDDAIEPISCFSKVYSDVSNPQASFAAIITCSDAEQNCPVILGTDIRVGITYEDPKVFDGTALQDTMYDERCRQIALESLYIFSQI